MYCHDVGIAKMQNGWHRIKTNFLDRSDEAFDLHFTSFDSTIVVRGNSDLKELMKCLCQELKGVYYFFGSRHLGIRSAFHMLLRTTLYSTRYGQYIRRFCLGSLLERIFE